MNDFPFKEQQIGKNVFLREFTKDVNNEELVWHRDREDRIVEVIEGRGWMLQLDEELPVEMKKGHMYLIPEGTYHRIMKGNSDLKIRIDFIIEIENVKRIEFCIAFEF